jgi:hypothetical protein
MAANRAKSALSAKSAKSAKSARPAKPGEAANEPTASAETGAASVGPRLSDDDAKQVLELLRKVDTVELKVTIPLDQHRATIRGLPIDPVEARPRQVYFFDTPDLALNKAGLVVRARRSQGDRGDTVIKLRPVVPDDLPAELRKLDTFVVEVDVLPGGFVCSASFKGTSTGERVLDAVSHALPLRKVFNRDQRAFFEQRAPQGLTVDDLAVLGPIFVLKSTFYADFSGRDQRMAAEVWLYPDETRVLELSLRCPPNQAFQVAQEARSYLAHRGITADENQTPKTRTALAYYAGQLRDSG